MGELPKFEVRFDRVERVLHWTMRGFWTVADVADFAAALRAAIEPLGPPPHRFDGLADSRNFPVQASDVSIALGRINEAGRATRIGRNAIVVGSLLNKLQVERTLVGNTRVFLDIEEARAWLRGGDRPV